VSHVAEGIMEPNPPTDELNSYAKGKQVAEKLCLDAGEQKICDSKIARLFAFSGRYLPRDTHFAIGNFIQNVLDRKPIFINSDGQSRRSYLYGADMATWLGVPWLNERLFGHCMSVQSVRSQYSNLPK
jgi:dTDP-glucose 4,6-dehydratase